MDFNELDAYNGETEHDMWVDFDNYEFRRNRGRHNYQLSPQNTGTPDVFDDPDLDEYIDNLNDWD